MKLTVQSSVQHRQYNHETHSTVLCTADRTVVKLTVKSFPYFQKLYWNLAHIFLCMITEVKAPILFDIFLERIMTDALDDHEGTVSIRGRTSTILCFADDIDGSAGEEEELAK